MLHAVGELLSIDLQTRETDAIDIDDVNREYLGGRGVCTRLAHERVPFDVDPLGQENRLFFATGPVQLSTMSFTGRTNCTGVSPLTGGLLSSNAGGFVSRNVAATGYAAVELRGESDELVTVHVTDEGVEFEHTPELAGATAPQVTAHVENEHDLGVEHVACIGPAGENEVRFAAIMTSESRAFGRGGLGAVLGAKNVKAITFDGDSSPDIDVPDAQMEIHREAATEDHIMKRQGTVSVTDLANELEALPTRYFSELTFEGVEGINGDAVESKKYKKGTCSQCAFACKLPTRDEATGLETEGPEYETVMAFGANSGVDDVVSVMKSNDLCDEYGMDTISCGNAVAAYLAANDEFGNSELIHELVEKVAHRDGVGDLLAEGVDRCHGELGVENWSVKGMDFAAHDGRTFHGQALSYAVANRGADHMYSTLYAWEYPLVSSEEALDPEGFEGKPRALIEQENARALEDCGILCRFSRGTMSPDRYWALFGAEYERLLEVGGRVVTLERHFNNQRGMDAAADTLPYDLPGLEAAKREYYELRGWGETGVVPDEELPYQAAV